MVWIILAASGGPPVVVRVGHHRDGAPQPELAHRRHGDIAVRVRRPGKKRWTRGHAIWVSDVFAWRGSPAAWNEQIVQVTDVTVRRADEAEQHTLRRLGDDLQIATLSERGRRGHRGGDRARQPTGAHGALRCP